MEFCRFLRSVKFVVRSLGTNRVKSNMAAETNVFIANAEEFP